MRKFLKKIKSKNAIQFENMIQFENIPFIEPYFCV